MNKGIGAIIVGIIAVIGGAALAALFLKNKLDKKKDEIDFDDLDNPVDDEEFEKFFGDDENDNAPASEEAPEAEEAAEDLEETDSDAEEQL